jgi:hypothetical protein
MAAELVNTIRIVSEQSYKVVGAGFERLMVNVGDELMLGDDSGISELTPIVNVGWDEAYNCMRVRKVFKSTDVVMGIALTPIGLSEVRLCRYITSGLLIGINTSSWTNGLPLYATSIGTLAGQVATIVGGEISFSMAPGDGVSALPEGTLVFSQEIARVERVHALGGEISVTIAGFHDPGYRSKRDVLVAAGAETPISFSRDLPSVPTVSVRVVDETGTSIGADVKPNTTTRSGFTVSVMAGGIGVHKMYYRAEVEV